MYVNMYEFSDIILKYGVSADVIKVLIGFGLTRALIFTCFKTANVDKLIRWF